MRLLAGALLLAGCSTGATASGTSASDPVPVSVSAPVSGSVSVPVSVSAPVAACGLPAPLKGEDDCAADADCGPSDPCHAHACVAAKKAKPRGATTMCTEIMDCKSTDANDCRCFEKKCALVPRH